MNVSRVAHALCSFGLVAGWLLLASRDPSAQHLPGTEEAALVPAGTRALVDTPFPLAERNRMMLLADDHAGEAFSADGMSAASPFRDTLEIRSVGVELSYDITEIRARAGDILTIRYDNSQSEMTHNFVLVRREEDMMPVGIAALEAHRNEYIPENEMERILAYSRLVYPGDTTEFSFVVPPPGTYPYICTYSGHFTMMQGRLVSTE